MRNTTKVRSATRSADRTRLMVKASARSPKKVARNNGAISPYGVARSTIKGQPLSPNELDKIDAYWRASLYLCVGMIYLKDNPLLQKPLKVEQIKARLLGHWGSD